MRRWKLTANIVNLISYEKSAVFLSFILCFCLAAPGVLRNAYADGTLEETVGTMEIGQEIDNGVNQNVPKGKVNNQKPAQDTNNVTGMPSRVPANTPVKPTQAAASTAIAETNVPEVNDFNEFKRELDRIDTDARGEDIMWLGKQEKKTELAQATNNVAVAELQFLLKVATEVNDTNTVGAIKLVLKKRQDRLQKLATKLENEAKEERQQQRDRRAPRPSGTQQGMTQTERPARNTNMQRANNQEQQ